MSKNLRFWSIIPALAWLADLLFWIGIFAGLTLLALFIFDALPALNLLLVGLFAYGLLFGLACGRYLFERERERWRTTGDFPSDKERDDFLLGAFWFVLFTIALAPISLALYAYAESRGDPGIPPSSGIGPRRLVAACRRVKDSIIDAMLAVLQVASARHAKAIGSTRPNRWRLRRLYRFQQSETRRNGSLPRVHFRDDLLETRRTC